MRNLLKVSALALLACGVLIACQDDETIGEKVNFANSNSVQLVEITENNEIIPVTSTRSDAGSASNLALRFASEEDYQKTLRNIESRDISYRLRFSDSLGLTSMQKLLQLADEELENIGANALSENDFRDKYNVYKEKYAKYFVFNQVDKSDLSAYMPEGDKSASFVVGFGHQVVIGDKVMEIAYNQKMCKNDSLLYASDLQVYENNPDVVTRATNEKIPVNNFIVKNGKKKTIFRFEPTRHNREFNVHFGAQKKMWYGWKRDPARDFYFKFGVSNFQYVVAGAAGHSVWTNVPEYNYSFLGSGGDTDVMTIGRGIGGDVSGNAYIWTDQTIERDANKNVALIKVNGKQYPKGDTNKALPCELFWGNGTY